MNWIKNVVRPRINNFLRRETPENLWIKCPETGQMVFHKDVAENQWVIPDSGAHLKISAHMRLHLMFDEGAYDVLPTPSVPTDPLKFKGRERYVEKLKAAQAQTNLSEAFLSGFGKLEGIPVVIGAHDMDFIAGTLGMAVGEAVIAAAEKAREHKTPLILFTSSGGARMQEGLFSLMQMPRTTIAIRRLREARLPYVVVLTNPTTGGVTASYAMLGDVHLAEPGALIGFAGPRVIEQTVREKLPEGFQKAEYLKAHGMIDEIVPRQKLRAKIGVICRILKKLPPENRTES